MKRGRLATEGLTREWLGSMRKAALRRGVWFRTLSKLERGIVELTISCVDKVKSGRLALALGRIVCKVLDALKSRFLSRVDSVGSEFAERISKLAVFWGYSGASSWAHDLGFVRCLGVNAVGNNLGWSNV